MKFIMKEKIENRLKELYDYYKHLTDKDRIWIKETGGLTRCERIVKCKILIEELETLLKGYGYIINPYQI